MSNWPAETKVIGQSTPRIDGAVKVTGKARYSSDIQAAGWLYGMILRSKWPAARILSVNLDKAQAALLRVKKGEAAIVTWRVYRTRGERLLIATRSLFPKDRYSYSIRNRRERTSIGATWSWSDTRQRAKVES